MSEILWGRLGFTIVGMISGLIFALTLSALIFPFSSDLNYFLIVKTFTVVFGVTGLILGPFITYSAQGCLWGLYVIYGYVMGFLGAELPGGVSGEMFPKKNNGLYFVLVGCVAGILCWLQM